MSDAAPARAHQAEAVGILKVPGTEHLLVCFAGPILGILTHRTKGRSIPCSGPETCPTGLHRSDTTYYGFAPAWSFDRQRSLWRPGALQITECLEEMLRGRPLLGELWLLSREVGKRKNTRVVGTFIERRDDPEFQRSWDVKPAVRRYYHETEIHFGASNPIPGKVMIEPLAVPAPALPELQAAPVPPPPPAELLEKVRKVLPNLAKRMAAAAPAAPAAEPAANGKHP
jgi:hypothetical protein